MENLANYIIKNSKFLKLDEMYNDSSMIYIKYFLDKSIKSLFGKTEFEMDQKNNPELSIDRVIGSKFNTFNIDFLTNHFSFICKENTILFSNNDDHEIFSVIKYDKDYNLYTCDIMSKNDGILVKESLKSYLNVPVSFEYQKTVNDRENIIEYPIYTMQAILYSPNNLEYFKLTSSEEKEKYNSLLKNIIYAIKDDSLVPVIAEEIPYSVFEKLEEKTTQYKKIRSR